MSQPQVKVGIMSSPAIRFVFPTAYSFGGQTVEGAQEATLSDGKVLWGGALYDSVEFTPCDAENGSFELIDVTIGVNFHWERKENQSFRGSLRIIVEGDKLTAVNILPIEEYLLSVISSEMSATASLELLKAHAVISRSWLLAQIEKNKQLAAEETPYNPCTRTEGELVRWYDREDHVNFDVCADDHCQRYQGITRESTATVRDAIKATWGQVLTYDGTTYQATIVGVDEDNDIALLKVDAAGVTPVTFGDSDSMSVGDTVYAVGNPLGELEFTMTSGMISALDRTITTSDGTDSWIRPSPEAFCNTTDKHILSQVLNSYDQETTDFYRWTVEYDQAELSRLVRERSGEDYGDIVDLIPVARGTSGRLYRLKIVGTKKTCIIGKELEIRRTLSPSHLYSSAFVVEKQGERDGLPERFVLKGAGWGHGVGLCQIGAAVMGEKGYDYKQILLHYFIDAEITKQY